LYIWCIPRNIWSWLSTLGIIIIHRIVCDISVDVEAVIVADGVGLQEASELGGVDPRLVVVQLQLWQPGLAGVLEPPPCAMLALAAPGMP
jgi:hypothetical protein